MSEIPVEAPRCSLPADQLALRKEELGNGLARRIVAARELPDGIALGFRPGADVRAEIDAFIAFESRCCSFPSYNVRTHEGDERTWLEIRGPVGTSALMGRLVPPTVAVERLGSSASWRRPFRWGAGGAASAVAVLLCCATPLLPLLLGALGLAVLLPWLGPWLDGAALALLVVSCGPLGWALHRRARARAALAAVTTGR